MPHDVFISHSSLDREVVDVIVAALEAAGIVCWIAPRDMIAAAPYTESIVRSPSPHPGVVLTMRAQRQWAENRRRCPNLDALEGRSLLSVSLRPRAAEVSTAPITIQIHASEQLSGLVTTIGHTFVDGSGHDARLGSFRSLYAIEFQPNGSGGFDVTGGSVVYTTARGARIFSVTGPPGETHVVLDPKTGHPHAVGTHYDTILGGTGRFKGATGSIIERFSMDLVTERGHNVESGSITVPRRGG